MVFIDRVRLLADRLDRSAIGGIRSDFTQSEVMGLNSEYVPLLFIPLKLVSSVYSLFKPSGKSAVGRFGVRIMSLPICVICLMIKGLV